MKKATMTSTPSFTTLTKLLFEQEIDLMAGATHLSDEQVAGINRSLAKLGIAPLATSVPAAELENELAPVTEAGYKIPGRANSKDVSIAPETIELARKFYKAGKQGENWYYDAAKTLQEGFDDEQELALFSLLLAATSVQTEIYSNFIEAGLLFNAIMSDMKNQPELLMRFVDDPKAAAMDTKTAMASQFASLELYKQAAAAKIINLPAKFGNVSRAISLMFNNRLDANTVVNMISNSVDLDRKGNFDARSPFFRKLKIANYALTLLDPEYASTDNNWFNVVVDTWMIRVFYPGKNPTEVKNLLGSERAYAEVARVVAELANEAGVSPHAMQAAIWLGIKREKEGDLGGVTDYVTAIRKLGEDYAYLWDGISKETVKLRDVIRKIDVGTAKQALNDIRATNIRNVIKRQTAARRAAKAAASSSTTGETTDI